MPKNREQLKQEYINSLDSFIAQNPTVGQLDTAKFRDFLIGLVEHESGFNPTARQGSYFGWYQTNKLDADPYKQHMNAFNHLNGLFNNTITKADIKKARDLGIKDSALMLKYWNQGNRVNNYLWNGRDSADGLGTLISKYGNDLTMPLDVYDYAMDNLYGDYEIKQGDNWFDLQKRVRVPGRDYATGGKDLWNLQKLSGRPFGSLRIGQTFNFGENPIPQRKSLIEYISNWWQNPEKLYNRLGFTPRNTIEMKRGGLIYSPFFNEDKEEKEDEEEIDDLKSFFKTYSSNYSSFPVEPVLIYNPIEDRKPTGVVEYSDDVVTTNPISTQTFHESTTPSIVKGTVEFKDKEIDVGNMQELIDLMRDEGISFRITSGKRVGSKTSNGRISHHNNGDAIDITPIKGQSWDDLLRQMKNSNRFITYMNEHGLGILDERSEAMQKKTGATGAHFHIGPDTLARTQFKYLFNTIT